MTGTLAYGLWRSRHKAEGADEFLTGGRSLGAVVVGVTLASQFLGPGNILAGAEEAFKRGGYAAWSIMTLGLAFLFLAYGLAARYRATGHYTTSGALGALLGPALKPVTSAVLLVALCSVNVATYTGGTAATALLLNIPFPWTVAVCGTLVAVGVSAGGMRYLASANMVHTTCSLLGCVLGALYGLRAAGGLGGVQASVPPGFTSFLNVPPSIFAAWLIANLGAVGSSQGVVQILGSADSTRNARQGAVVAAGIMVVGGALVAVAGLASRSLFPTAAPSTAFPILVTLMPPLLKGIVVAGLAGGMLATSSGNVLAVGTLIVKDFYVPYIRPRASGEEAKKASRWFSLAAGLLPIPFVLAKPGLFPLIFMARGLRVTLFTVLIAAFFLPLLASGRATWAIGLGAAATGAWFLAGSPFGIDGAYVSVLVPLVVLYLTKRQTQTQVAKAAS